MCQATAIVAPHAHESVSTRLGHATTAMFLDRYTHRVSSADRAASEIIGRLLTGQTAEVTPIANAEE